MKGFGVSVAFAALALMRSDVATQRWQVVGGGLSSW
jgi:hypothetical protein